MCEKRLPPIHPGEILREGFMKPLNLSTNALTQRLGVTRVSTRLRTNGVALPQTPPCDWYAAFPRHQNSG